MSEKNNGKKWLVFDSVPSFGKSVEACCIENADGGLRPNYCQQCVAAWRGKEQELKKIMKIG